MRVFIRRFTPWPCVLLLVALLVAGLAACGAGQAWQGSVKIGLVVPFYGYDSGSANSAYFAIKLALRERNEAGGIGGRWVELIALDDQNSPGVAARKAREMALDPGVLGVVGHLSSDTAAAAAAGYREAGLSAITLGGSASELASASPALLRVAPSDLAVATHALQVVSRHIAVRRIAVVYDRSPGHSSAARGFLDEANRLKLEIGTTVVIERNQRDFEPLLAALSTNPPDLLIFVGDQFQAVSLTAQARVIRSTMRILIAGCANTPDFATIGGEGASGVLHAGFAIGADGAASTEFADRYRASFGFTPATYAFAANDASSLLLDAMERALLVDGKLDRASVFRQIRTPGVGRFGVDGGRNEVQPLLFEIDASGYPGKLWR